MGCQGVCNNNREQKGFTLWFTGLSGAGKTTIAQKVEQALRDRGLKVEMLDGDVVRTNLSKGLGFSKEDRDINIKRIGFVCKLLTRNGVIAIASAISPYREVRDYNRREIGDFVEVFVKCPLETCIQRDVKGLYKKALAGEIKNYTGVSDPYEDPLNPEVIVETHQESVEESAARVLAKLMELEYIPDLVASGSDSEEDAAEEIYSEEEEEKIKQRLRDLGYI